MTRRTGVTISALCLVVLAGCEDDKDCLADGDDPCCQDPANCVL